MNIEQNNGTAVVRRTKEQVLPASWRDLRMASLCKTADALHQPIGCLVKGGNDLVWSSANRLTSTAGGFLIALMICKGFIITNVPYLVED